MSYSRVSLLVPTRKRPKYLQTFIESYFATTSGRGDCEIVFRVDYDDLESLEMLAEHGFLTVVGPRRQGYRSLPGFYNEMVRVATGDILMCCNDDVVIETPGWPQAIIEAANRYPDGIFNIGVSTIMHEESYVFSCVSRKMVDRLGFINDERLVYSDIFLLDVAKAFGRLHKLWSVVFRHTWSGSNPEGVDQTYLDAQRVQFETVFKDATGAWSDKYQNLHESVVAEAVARIDPHGEYLAGQALLDYEAYEPLRPVAGAYWPPGSPALPWSAPYRGGAGTHYHRDEIFELLKVIASRRLPRRRALLTARHNGLPALLWGQLYDQVVMLDEAKEPDAIAADKYRIEFGAVYDAPFMYGMLDRIGEIDVLVLDSDTYPCLISPYFMVRRVMPRPALIAVMNTAVADGGPINQARRFVNDLTIGQLDGMPHHFEHIALPGGRGISYELIA